MKPGHQGGYSDHHATLCERTLVSLLRDLGPWRDGIYLVGGLVPRYLIPVPASDDTVPPHAGTTDVDLVLDLDVLADTDAYRTLEQNLRRRGFERSMNEDGRPQHFRWRKPVGPGITVVVDLLCEPPPGDDRRVIPIATERRLSAIAVAGAHLVVDDPVEVSLTAELLDERGVTTQTVRVANIVPFIVLKALAYEDRAEEKDAYDLIYCLEHYEGGPAGVAAQFVGWLRRRPEEPLLRRALEILRDRFASDERTQGARKEGPTHYARFLTDPGQSELDAIHRQSAAGVVEEFLRHVEGGIGGDGP